MGFYIFPPSNRENEYDFLCDLTFLKKKYILRMFFPVSQLLSDTPHFLN